MTMKTSPLRLGVNPELFQSRKCDAMQMQMNPRSSSAQSVGLLRDILGAASNIVHT